LLLLLLKNKISGRCLHSESAAGFIVRRNDSLFR
jgi:hypothetical protein